MADLINRQDAIDKLRYMGYMDKNNEVEEALMRLPSVQPKLSNNSPKLANKNGELISRQDAIDVLETIGYDFSDSGLSEIELEEVCEAVGDVRQDMIRMIKRLPFAQPEIIRCKDCKHYDGRPCGIVNWYNTATDYCSKRERREDKE